MIAVRTIRQEAVALLKAANIPGVLDRVYPSRARKIWPDEGDLLLVYTQESDADDQNTAPVIYKVLTTLVVQAMVQGTDEEDPSDEEEEAIEARLDELTEAVVRAMQPVVFNIMGPLNGSCDWVTWKGTRPVISGDGDVLRNSRAITFSVTWSQSLPDDPCPDDFNTSGTTLGGPAAANAPAIDATFTTQQRIA